MPTYGKDSTQALNTAHPDLIAVFQEVIKLFDNKIVYGTRTPEEQFILYKKGRKFINGKWIIVNKGQVVTYKDGINDKSNHNYSPSKAVDAIPFPVDWGDDKRMYYFAGHVMAVAARLKADGKISHTIKWLGDMDMDTQVNDQTFMDLAHFEIVE